MASHDAELLAVAEKLLSREPSRRGQLPRARVRRSVSTAYYALFHFLLEEVGRKIVGTHGNLLERRRILARAITHKGAKDTLDKVRGARIHASVDDFLKPLNAAGGMAGAPPFVRSFANAFIDAQAKRHEADYDLNANLSESDAKLLAARAKHEIQAWRAATSDADRDFKHALCILLVLTGKWRPEA